MAAIVAGGAVGVISFLVGLQEPSRRLFNVDLGLLTAYAISAVVLVAVSLATHDKLAKHDQI